MPQDAFGLASLYDPSIAVDEQALARQMAVAQLLRQQSMEAAGRTQMAGNVAIRNSPLEGVAKVVQALRASQMDTQNDASRQTLSQKAMTAMAAALRGEQPNPGAAPAGAPVPGNIPTGGPASAGGSVAGPGMDVPSLVRGGIIGQLGGPAMAGAYAKQFEPTEMERMLRAAGVDPASPMGRQMLAGRAAKENYIPPANIRPGGYTQDPMTGTVTNFPHVPDGFQAIPDGKGGFSIQPVPGGLEAIGASKRSTAAAEAAYRPEKVFNPATNQYEFRSVEQVVGGGRPQSAQIPPEVLAADRAGKPFYATQAPGQPPQFQSPAGLSVTEPPRPGSGASFSASPSLGAEAGANAAAKSSQDAIDKSWEPLKAQVREAANTKSYLQSIVQAADKGAITGPGADRRELVQGLLQIAGINEKVNENAVTQTQLLDKYHNQIVARLGQGGLGTDAARAILDSAYPGKAMNPEAIREAAANLNGAQDMLQSKARFLQEPAIKRDSAEYQRREITFDQNADPRIWQWRGISDPAKRSAFAKELVKQDPTILQRIQALEKAGAL